MAGFLGLPWDPAVLGTATAYGAMAQKTANMRLRAEQVARPITANSGKWRDGLTPAESRRSPRPHRRALLPLRSAAAGVTNAPRRRPA